MSVAAHSANQSQTIHINNILEFVIERGPIITVPLALIWFYRVFMSGMNNSMDNFSQKGKIKSANSTHMWKIAVSLAIFTIIILVVFCLKKITSTYLFNPKYLICAWEVYFFSLLFAL